MKRFAIFFFVVASPLLARVDVDFSTDPGRYIGRLEKVVSQGTSICTATLVGPQLILTAGHCVSDSISLTHADPSVDGVTFKLNYSNGKFVAESELEGLITGPNYANNPLPLAGNDWVLAKLKEPLGLKYGWVELSYQGLNIGTEVQAAGYSSDWNDSEHPGIDDCKILPPVSLTAAVLNRLGIPTGNYYVTNCAINHGASGGPIFAQFSYGQGQSFPEVVAVNHALDLSDETLGITVMQAYPFWATSVVAQMMDYVPANAAKKRVALDFPFNQWAKGWSSWTKTQRVSVILQQFPSAPQLDQAVHYLEQYFE